MKDLFLIPILLVTFVFGYYVVAKFGDFIDENQRRIAEGNRNGVAATYILHQKIRYCLIPLHLRWKTVQKQLPILSSSSAAVKENTSWISF